MKAIIGLGNPGPKYEKTRHNAGFWVVDAIARRLGVAVNRAQAKSMVGTARWEGEEILLAKPLTYMNQSGEAVRALLQQHSLVPDEILVIYDDLDLTPGVIRLRAKGRAGSHNGMRSIINYLGTQDFPRLRIGIGPVPDRMRGVDYVLGSPDEAEWVAYQEAIEAGALAALTWSVHGVTAAMSRYNRSWAPDAGKG